MIGVSVVHNDMISSLELNFKDGRVEVRYIHETVCTMYARGRKTGNIILIIMF